MSSTGNKGKFSERVKQILYQKRKKNVNDEEIKDSNLIYNDFLKVLAAIPIFVYGGLVVNSDSDKVTSKNDVNDNLHDLNNSSSSMNNNNRKRNRDLISKIDINEIKNKQTSFYRAKGFNFDSTDKKKNSLQIDKFDNYDNKNVYNKNKNDLQTDIDIKSEKQVKELEKSIINLIKKDLIRIVNEMEILQSELYILSEVNGDGKVLKNCQRELDQVKSLICKIDKLKNKYDFLKDNHDFEYLLEIDNNDLVDKIIKLRNTFGNNELKAVTEDYKLLDVYKYLYLKLDDLKEKTEEFEEHKKKEILKLKERDIDFEKLKKDVYNVDYTNRSYDSFVENQNALLNEIDKSVSKIDSYEQVDLRLKGFGALFRNSFKFFGLLMLSPLKGVIPSIATETLLTGNLIKNLYKNLELEETRRMVYEAMDYSSMINNAIRDLDSTSRIVDTTLDDIVRLKMKYNEKFKQYKGDFSEYRDIMNKINDMENKILGNKIKIEMMRKRALEQERVNQKKLVLVKELNKKQENRNHVDVNNA